jgi:YjbR
MTANRFRAIALGMSGAVESAHMGHPDFRVAGKIFATLHPDMKYGMVKLTPDDQERFVRDHPAHFAPENGAWGRQGSTRVTLASVDEETLGEAMTLACQNVARTAALRRRRRTP